MAKDLFCKMSSDGEHDWDKTEVRDYLIYETGMPTTLKKKAIRRCKNCGYAKKEWLYEPGMSKDN